MKKWQCPACNGRGGYVDVICEGRGPFEPCGFCKGTGELTRRTFYRVLGYESWWRRREKQRKLAALRTTSPAVPLDAAGVAQTLDVI